MLHVLLGDLVVEATSNQALGREQGMLWVLHGLTKKEIELEIEGSEAGYGLGSASVSRGIWVTYLTLCDVADMTSSILRKRDNRRSSSST